MTRTAFKTLAFLALFALAIPRGFPGAAHVPRLHPMLVRLIHEDPAREVTVIVQIADATMEAESLIRRLGGEITDRLGIINALAARLPASGLPELAASPAVKWISPDAEVKDTRSDLSDLEDTAQTSAFIGTIGADLLRAQQPSLQGQGIIVAVVDSGIDRHPDLNQEASWESPRRIVDRSRNPGDLYGHGTHIAGIIGGNGFLSDGAYQGVAPQVNLANVHVTRMRGAARTSDIIRGLQWIYDNKDALNIRVVNLSLNSTVAESYHTSPLDAALEVLWFNGIVVIVSAGNRGEGAELFPPANDPFVITVGALDDYGTVDPSDDSLADYSAFGVTPEGFTKPEILAPGNNLVSLQATPWSLLSWQHPDHKVGRYYFRMSGTSMASAVAAGAVALLLQDEPGLNPDQVKHRLMATARPFGEGNGPGSLDIYAAVHGVSTEAANTGIPLSQLLGAGPDPILWGSVNWGSVNWGAVNWGAVNWGAVNWGAVKWGAVNWGADYWGP